MKKNKKSKKRYNLGTGVQGLGFSLASASILELMEAINDGMSVDNRSLQRNFAMGGKVGIEAEGEEVMEEPDGTVSEINGPRHEQGGVDLDLDPGTIIYSDRISVDGESLADRKEKRTKKLGEVQKKLEDDPFNQIMTNTVKSVEEYNQLEEQADLMMQDLIRKIEGEDDEAMYGYRKKAVFGIDDPPSIMDDWQGFTAARGIPGEVVMPPPSTDPVAGLPLRPGLAGPQRSIRVSDNPFSQLASPDAITQQVMGDPVFQNAGSMMKQDLGDMMQPRGDGGPTTMNMSPVGQGMDIGSIADTLSSTDLNQPLSQFGSLGLTLANRFGDPDNINYYQDYGADALNELNRAGEGLAAQRDQSIQDIDLLQSDAFRANKARGLSNANAYSLAVVDRLGKQKAKVRSDFQSKEDQLRRENARLRMAAEDKRAAGEEAKDLKDVQDRDAFYTNLGTSLQSMLGNIPGMSEEMKELMNMINGLME